MGTIPGRKITCHIKPHNHTYSFIQSLKENGVYIIKLSTNSKGANFTILEKDLPIVRRIRKQYKIPLHFTRLHENRILQLKWTVLIGVIGFIFLPYLCSLFLWQISVEDVSDERKVKLESELNSLSVVERKLINNLATDMKIRQVLLSNNHDLSWVHIKRSGSKLHITSVPAPVITRKQTDQQVPSNLVALRRGIITNYDLRSGERLVRINNTVNKGDMLVTGVLKQGKKDIIVGAEGRVFADFWRETSFQLNTKIVYDKFSSEQLKILQVSPSWKEFTKQQTLDNFVEVIKSVFRIEKHTLVEKSTQTLDEQWIKEAFLPMLRIRTASTLTPKGKIKDEKILHLTWSNDTVKGKVLYYMNDNIAGKSPIPKETENAGRTTD